MKSTIDKGKSFNESDLMVMAEIEKLGVQTALKIQEIKASKSDD